jgi:hypothetical protein
MSKMTVYKADLLQRYWKYQETRFENEKELFDDKYVKPASPPVFKRSKAQKNVIFYPSASEQEKEKLWGLIPVGERQRWYGSMNSSQALAQSVLGNLFVYSSLHCLSELEDYDTGISLLGKGHIPTDDFKMEYKINYLGESRPTSLDGFLPREYQIAIECKFTEAEVGTCSRPRLTPEESNYERDHCNRTYSIQRSRKARCSLTESGILYWQYVPDLFTWKIDGDLFPCPLYKNYQLVRNILAAGVKPSGQVSLDNGHVVLIYDERNPAFQNGGVGLEAYNEVKAALRKPTMIRKCSWQRIVRYLRDNSILPWLTDELALKYGL